MARPRMRPAFKIDVACRAEVLVSWMDVFIDGLARTGSITTYVDIELDQADEMHGADAKHKRVARHDDAEQDHRDAACPAGKRRGLGCVRFRCGGCGVGGTTVDRFAAGEAEEADAAGESEDTVDEFEEEPPLPSPAKARTC